MKKTLIAIALIILMCFGCATTQKSYQTSATITQDTLEDRYTVLFKITEIEGETETILSQPKITVNTGMKGKIQQYDEAEQSGVFCTALVTEEGNKTEAITSVIIMNKGKEDVNNTHTLIIEN